MKITLSLRRCLVASSLFLNASAWKPIVTIDAGVLIGTIVTLPTAPAPVNEFLGVPFAQSPPERFSPPAPPKRWEQPLKVAKWKPACIQQFNYPEASRNFTLGVFNNPPPEESEDCLYLNVYAPSTPPPPDGRAVMFWIYGGSLQFGNAGQQAYNGTSFAAHEDVIVVTVNYRTNAFGFPNSPELPLDGNNLGFLDQRAGLNWVQRNIRSFGGDPAKVTIFGESAGGFSVDALLTSYPKGSTPPFRAAILESGQLSYRPTPWTPSTGDWYTLASALNCTGPSNLTCIRAAPATAIKSIVEHQALSFNPVPDNITLVSDPASRRVKGNIANIPTLSGTNSQEGRFFEAGETNLTEFYQQYLSPYPSIWPILTEAYTSPEEGLNTPFEIASQIFTEYFFQCPEALWANASAKVGINTWRYYFNASFPDTQVFPEAGVYHGSEIELVFKSYAPDKATIQEDALSTSIQGIWARFAKNPAGGPGWAALGTGATYFGGKGDEDLALLGNVGDVEGSGVTVIRQSDVDERCSVFDEIYKDALGW